MVTIVFQIPNRNVLQTCFQINMLCLLKFLKIGHEFLSLKGTLKNIPRLSARGRTVR